MDNPGKSLPSAMMVNGRMVSDPIFALPLKLSKNFTIPGSIKISELYRAIVSSELLPSFQIAYAMPCRVTSGADVVVVLPYLGNMAEIITPYGMLLLQWLGEPVATTAASLTSFIKDYMEGLDNMDEEDKSRLQELEDQALLVSTLHAITQESTDADSVRMAYGALLATEAGRIHLRENGFKL